MGMDVFSVTGVEGLRPIMPENPYFKLANEFREAISCLVGSDRPLTKNIDTYDESQRETIKACIEKDRSLYNAHLRTAELYVENEKVWDPKNPDSSQLSFEAAQKLFEAIPALGHSKSQYEFFEDAPVEVLHGLNMHLIQHALGLLGYYHFFGQGEGRFLTEFNNTRDNWTIVMSRNGSRVSMQLWTSCYALQLHDSFRTLNQEGNALVDCKKFEDRNQEAEFFSAVVTASIDFSQPRALAEFSVKFISDCNLCDPPCEEDNHGFKYVGPKNLPEIIQLENQTNGAHYPIVSPRPPSHTEESRRLSSSSDSSENTTARSVMSINHDAASEQWAKWLVHNPFFLGFVGSVTLERLFVEGLSILNKELGAGRATTQGLANYSFLWGLVGGFPGAWEGMQALSKLEDCRHPKAIERHASGLLNGAISYLFSMVLFADVLKNADKKTYLSLSSNDRSAIIIPPAAMVGLIHGAWYILSQSSKDSLRQKKPWLVLMMHCVASITLQLPRFSVALDGVLPEKQTMSEHVFLSLTASIILSALGLTPFKQRAALFGILFQVGLLMYASVQNLRSDMHASDENQASPAILYIRLVGLSLLFFGSLYPMYKVYPGRSGFQIWNERQSLVSDRTPHFSYGANDPFHRGFALTHDPFFEAGPQEDEGPSDLRPATVPLLPEGPTSQPDTANTHGWQDDSPGPVRRERGMSQSSSVGSVSTGSLFSHSPKSAMRKQGSGPSQGAGKTLTISPELPTKASAAALSRQSQLWAPDSPPSSPLTWDANRRRPSPLGTTGQSLSDEDSLPDGLDPEESKLASHRP